MYLVEDRLVSSRVRALVGDGGGWRGRGVAVADDNLLLYGLELLQLLCLVQ